MSPDHKKATLKKCPECGAGFSCFGEDDCWCESIQLSPGNRYKLLTTYHDCLCKSCLSKYALK